MAKLKSVSVLFFSLSLLVLSACSGGGVSSPSSAGGEILTGLITASQVDVTGDDGSLLADRLNVGDIVYIVASPAGGARPGWVRVSRSAEDSSGFGWVESKNIRTVSAYRVTGSDQSEPFDAPAPVEEIPEAVEQAVVPEVPQAPEVPADDPFGFDDLGEDPLGDAGTAGEDSLDEFEDVDDFF